MNRVITNDIRRSQCSPAQERLKPVATNGTHTVIDMRAVLGYSRGRSPSPRAAAFALSMNDPPMFGQVPPTQFDLNFRLLGVPVRVHPVFWLTSAFLAWSPEELDATIVGILCIFVAIIVHEMGHALMNARFGFRSEVVLYFLGGYATTMRHSTWRDIAVLAAGPTAGFLLFAAVWAAAVLGGAIHPDWNIVSPPPNIQAMSEWPEAIALGTRANLLLYTAIHISLFINFIWTCMNLLPVFPLDGGQISRALFLHYGGRNGLANSLWLSVIVGATVAAVGLFARDFNLMVFGRERSLLLAVMFGYLAFQSWQELQNPYGRGGW